MYLQKKNTSVVYFQDMSGSIRTYFSYLNFLDTYFKFFTILLASDAIVIPRGLNDSRTISRLPSSNSLPVSYVYLINIQNIINSTTILIEFYVPCSAVGFCLET